MGGCILRGPQLGGKYTVKRRLCRHMQSTEFPSYAHAIIVMFERPYPFTVEFPPICEVEEKREGGLASEVYYDVREE